MKRDSAWWDRWYLGMAKYVSTGSKDPSTKVGAVIVRPDRTQVSIGYNGFARGVEDTEERLNNRELKNMLTAHAEENAIWTSGERLHGYTIYIWPLFSCVKCAQGVINTGIKRVVSPTVDLERWRASIELAQMTYREAGVEYELLDLEAA